MNVSISTRKICEISEVEDLYNETVEKAPEQILGRDAERNDLIECAPINDLGIMRGHETSKNHPSTIPKGFLIISAETEPFRCLNSLRDTVKNHIGSKRDERSLGIDIKCGR